jgi:hypothetical protein
MEILYTTLGKPFLWQREKKGPIEHRVFFIPKNLFFLLMNHFLKDRQALEPTASVKILYTTLEKPFF